MFKARLPLGSQPGSSKALGVLRHGQRSVGGGQVNESGRSWTTVVYWAGENYRTSGSRQPVARELPLVVGEQ